MFVTCAGFIMAVSLANCSTVVCKVGRDISWFCRFWKMVWMGSVARMNSSGDSGSPWRRPRRWSGAKPETIDRGCPI
jgi:hypothetical protein